MSEQKKGGGILGFVKDFIIVALVALAVITLVKPIVVQKTSMEPTLHQNDYLIVSKQAYTVFGDPGRGDIVVFPHQTGELSELYIKRVIGLPGERITITGGKVYINGMELTEDYTMDGVTSGEISDYLVPEGKVFVMGDNRLVSVDSRSNEVGCVDIDTIIGKAILRVYPFGDFGLL